MSMFEYFILVSLLVFLAGGFKFFFKTYPERMKDKSFIGIKKVMTDFVDGKINFLYNLDGKCYSYKNGDFEIKIHSHHELVHVSLFNNMLGKEKEFFSFYYNSFKDGIMNKKEKNTYYKKQGYYSENADMFDDFIVQFRKNGWGKKSENQQELIDTLTGKRRQFRD